MSATKRSETSFACACPRIPGFEWCRQKGTVTEMGEAKRRRESAKRVLERVRDKLLLGLTYQTVTLSGLIEAETSEPHVRRQALRLFGAQASEKLDARDALTEIEMALHLRWPILVPDPTNHGFTLKDYA